MSSCDCHLKAVNLQELALGPAYAEWKAGTLDLTAKFESTWPLYPAWMDNCCRHAKLDITKRADWKGQLAIVIAFVVFFTAGLSLFYAYRHRQLLRVRNWWMVLSLAVGCTIFVTFRILGYMAGGTFPLRIQPYIFFSTIVYMNFHYILRACQLLFVYHWNAAKLDYSTGKSEETLKRFQIFKFVLHPRFYPIACSVCILMNGIAPAAMVTQNPIWSDPGDVEFSSVRCNWFHIPDQYTVASSNASACACVNSYYLKQESYTTKCDSHLSSCVNDTTLDAEFCKLCATTSGAAYDENCVSWLYDTFTSGECGFPQHVPHFSSCVSALNADSFGLTFLLLTCALFNIVNVSLVVGLLRMKDYFGMTREILCGLFIGIFPFYILIITLPYVWSYTYPSDLFSGVLCTTVLLSVAVFFPMTLYWWRQRAGLSAPDFKSRRTHTSDPGGSKSPSHNDSHANNSKDEHVWELDRCLDTEELLRVYERFTVQEFTTENVRFLGDCRRLQATKEESKIASEAQRLLFWYIQSGAVLEINLPHKIRLKIQSSVEHLNGVLSSTPNSTSDGPVTAADPSENHQIAESEKSRTEALEAVMQAYSAAYKDIKRLVVQSSWPKFKTSPLFLEYKAVIKQLEDKFHVEITVNTWYSADSDARVTTVPSTEPSPRSLRPSSASNKKQYVVHVPWAKDGSQLRASTGADDVSPRSDKSTKSHD